MAPTKTAEEAISSPAEGGEVRNPNDVFWDGGQDPSNPKNWSAVRRWCHIVVVSLLTFVTSMGSSMLAPAVPDVMKSLHSDNAELQSFVVSIYVIGFVVGPLVVAPLSELFGRAIVYHVSNVVFLGATIGCALSTNVGMFLAFRLLCGCAGAAPLALGGGSISDIMEPERMGTAMAVWGLGSLVPPETYAPVLLAHKAKRLRKETGNLELRSRLDQQQLSQQEVVIGTLVRPLRILLTSPIVMLLAIDVAIVYGYQYLVFTTLSYIFQDQYHLSTGLSGLVYLGNGIGTILGIFIIGHASDKVTEHRKKKASDPDEPLPPEGWLWPMLPAGMLVPAGLFWYGWSLQSNAFVVVPLVGLGVFGFGMMGIFQPVQIYVVNAFGKHAASAMAATAVLRSLVGALLPLGGQRINPCISTEDIFPSQVVEKVRQSGEFKRY
ncbi:hypothetical protein APSETT444_000468 [Aspergillus pseudonomiae]